MLDILHIASAVLLGILSGALLTEGMVLVPHWRSLHAAEFAALHSGFAPRLYRFFAPLTIVAVTVTVVSGIFRVWTDDSRSLWPSLGAGIAAVSLPLFYGAYFHGANERLPSIAAGGNQSELHTELVMWQRVHHLRTAICATACLFATFAITN